MQYNIKFNSGGIPRRKVFPIREDGGETNIHQLNKPKHSNDRVYGSDGISPTLNTMQGGNRQPFVAREERIRRLTPLETLRLQGFPDDWFPPEMSANQKYKQCGNAVTVNVIEAIFNNLLK